MNAVIKSSPAHEEQGALRWVLTRKKEKGEKRKHVTNLGSYSHLLKPGASPTRLTLRTWCQEEHEQDVNRKARGSRSQRAGTGDGDSVLTPLPNGDSNVPSAHCHQAKPPAWPAHPQHAPRCLCPSPAPASLDLVLAGQPAGTALPEHPRLPSAQPVLTQHANGQTQRAGGCLSPDTVQPRQTSFTVYNVWIYAVCTHCSPTAGRLPVLAVLSHRCSKTGQKSLLKIHTCVFHCPSTNTKRGLRTD